MTDLYGVTWDLPASELCPTCGQPDNCGDCSHKPLTEDEVYELQGNEDGSNRDVPPFDNDPRSDEQIKQEVYDRWARGEQDGDYGEEDR